MAEKETRVLLDACCLINLLATGRIAEILDALPYRFGVSELVAEKEVLGLAPSQEAAGDPSPTPRDLLASLVRADLLEVLALRTAEEASAFVRFATALDDGEASVCALAVVEGAAIATDDRKAIRLLGEWAPEVRVIQTPELLFEWAIATNQQSAEIRRVLTAVRERARFVPRKGSPGAEWWRSNR